MKTLFFLDKKPSLGSSLIARGIDYCIFYLLFSLTSIIFPFYIEDFYYVGFALLIPLFWAPIEALLVSKTKTTPGKFLLGIRIETHLGGKLPFWIALKRSFFFGIRPGLIKQRKIKIWRYFVAICTFCALLGSSYFENEIAAVTTGFEKYRAVEGWKEYTTADGRFSVIFPQDPEHETGILPVPSQNKTLSYDEFKSYQSKKVYYSVSYMELPKKWKLAGANKLLNGALDLMVEHMPATQLLGSEMTKHKNLRALDFHLSQGEEEVKGRLILVGTTLFRLTAVYPPSLAGQLQDREFVNSFTIHS
ncbi:MAG: RDD family protein [Rhabdochlamydiaceae bacterium]|nr:RDD family protein [Rhabdochlamydiaceae bacterium]